MEIILLNHVLDELEKNENNKKTGSQEIMLPVEAGKQLQNFSEEIIPETSESVIHSDFEQLNISEVGQGNDSAEMVEN